MPFFFGGTVADHRVRGGVVALCAGIACVVSGGHMNAEAAENFDVRRAVMIAEIGRMAHDTARETGREALDPRVIAALRKVDRHRFVPSSQMAQAYDMRNEATASIPSPFQPVAARLSHRSLSPCTMRRDTKSGG